MFKDELKGRLSESELAELIVKHAKNPSPPMAKPYIFLLIELYELGIEGLGNIESSFKGYEEESKEEWENGNVPGVS